MNTSNLPFAPRHCIVTYPNLSIILPNINFQYAQTSLTTKTTMGCLTTCALNHDFLDIISNVISGYTEEPVMYSLDYVYTSFSVVYIPRIPKQELNQYSSIMLYQLFLVCPRIIEGNTQHLNK
jgi:hypothetical protein